MGYKLIILLGLLLGILYSIHILVQDYQAITAPKLLRLLFKRDIGPRNYSAPSVRWGKILTYDKIQCARLLYCAMGAQPTGALRRGFILMLSLEPRDEDKESLEIFKTAYDNGRKSRDEEVCRMQYPICPFNSSLLIDLIKYLLRNK